MKNKRPVRIKNYIDGLVEYNYHTFGVYEITGVYTALTISTIYHNASQSCDCFVTRNCGGGKINDGFASTFKKGSYNGIDIRFNGWINGVQIVFK